MSAGYDKSELESASVRITTATTTVIHATKRVLIKRVIVGTTAAGTISIQNGAGTVIALLKASVAEGSYEIGVPAAGCQIVTGAASDLTVVYHLLA